MSDRHNRGVGNLAKVIETKHKLESGYWLTPEQQMILVKQWVAIINRRVTDDETKQLIAKDIAALPFG